MKLVECKQQSWFQYCFDVIATLVVRTLMTCCAAVFVLGATARRLFRFLMPSEEDSPDQPPVLVFTNSLESDRSPQTSCPVVVVRGMLVSTPINTRFDKEFPWGKSLPADSDIIIAPISCIASAHDRACELWAFLTGTTTNYGEAHAADHGHSVYGPVYSSPGYEEWSEDNPIVLFGHSIGGLTVMAFQDMIARSAFGPHPKTGRRTNARWIKTVVTMQAPLRGTPGVEATHAHYNEDHLHMPFGTASHALSTFVLLYTKYTPAWIREIYELECPFSQQTRDEYSLWDCLSPNGTWITGRDTCLWDLRSNLTGEALEPHRFVAGSVGGADRLRDRYAPPSDTSSPSSSSDSDLSIETQRCGFDSSFRETDRDLIQRFTWRPTRPGGVSLHRPIQYLALTSHTTRRLSHTSTYAVPMVSTFPFLRRLAFYLGSYEFPCDHTWMTQPHHPSSSVRLARTDSLGSAVAIDLPQSPVLSTGACRQCGSAGCQSSSYDLHVSDGLVPVVSQTAPYGLPTRELEITDLLGHEMEQFVLQSKSPTAIVRSHMLPGVVNVLRLHGDHAYYQFCVLRQHFFQDFFRNVFAFASQS